MKNKPNKGLTKETLQKFNQKYRGDSDEMDDSDSENEQQQKQQQQKVVSRQKLVPKSLKKTTTPQQQQQTSLPTASNVGKINQKEQKQETAQKKKQTNVKKVTTKQPEIEEDEEDEEEEEEEVKVSKKVTKATQSSKTNVKASSNNKNDKGKKKAIEEDLFDDEDDEDDEDYEDIEGEEDEDEDDEDYGSDGSYDTEFDGNESESPESKDIFYSIRRLANSQLASHKEVLAVLAAVEDTIREKMSDDQMSPTAYFATLMTLLEQQDIKEEAFITAIFQLLSTVFPKLPPTVLRVKFADVTKIISSTLESLFTPAIARYGIECLKHCLLAQDQTTWALAPTISIFKKVLSISTDPRPKVRKTAQDCIRRLLSIKYISDEALVHVSKFCLSVFQKSNKLDPQKALHISGFLRNLIPLFPRETAEEICKELNRMIGLGHSFLTVSIFRTLEFQFSHSDCKISTSFLSTLLDELLDIKPHMNDSQQLIPWLSMITSGFKKLQDQDSSICSKKFPILFTSVMTSMGSEKKDILSSATENVQELLMHCVTENVVKGKKDKKDTSNESTPLVNTICEQVENYQTYRFRNSWEYVLQITGTLFEVLGRSSFPVLTQSLKYLDQLYQSEQPIVDKNILENSFHSAIRAIGPQNLLSILPLNLFSEKAKDPNSRPWLLSMLKGNISHSQIGFFVEKLLPLAEFAKSRMKFNSVEGQNSHIIYLQIWSLFQDFCTLPTDTSSTFPKIAQNLGNLINTDEEVRPMVCNALMILIEKNYAISHNEDATHDLSHVAKESLSTVAKFSKNFLPILFNLHISFPNAHYVLDLISSFMKCSDNQTIDTFFKKAMKNLLGLTGENKEKEEKSKEKEEKDRREAHSLIDILTCMIHVLKGENVSVLYRFVKVHLQDSDAAIQKKCYKALSKFVETGKYSETVGSSLDELQSLLLDTTLSASPTCKKDRFKCMKKVMELLEDKDLHLVASVLPEVILGTKESGEKTRQHAFSLLIEMASRMEKGGKVYMGILTGEERFVDATIDEFLNMVVAGLAGTTPHMMSATVNCLSRVIYEFYGSFSKDLLNTLVKAILSLFASKSKELVKSVVGFVKVIVVTLDVGDLGLYVPEIVEGMVNWSNEKTNHMRTKIKHIFERLIKKIGFENIYELVPEEHQKFLNSIKKQKERAKKKKERARLGHTNESKPSYDQIMRDSDESDDELPAQIKEQLGSKAIKGRKDGTWIEENDDEDVPMDFLDRRVLSKVVATKPTARKQKEDDSKFDEEGKLIIEDEDKNKKDKRKKKNVLPTALDLDDLMNEVSSKFHRKRKASAVEEDNENEDGEDDDEDDGKGSWRPLKEQKKLGQSKDLGKEYKSKKAAGDLKKKGKFDPYAYLPLNPNALNRRKKAKISTEIKTVLKSAHKGVEKGKKAKFSQKKRTRK